MGKNKIIYLIIRWLKWSIKELSLIADSFEKLLSSIGDILYDTLCEKDLTYRYYEFSEQERRCLDEMVDYLKVNEMEKVVIRFVENKKLTLKRESFSFVLDIEELKNILE